MTTPHTPAHPRVVPATIEAAVKEVTNVRAQLSSIMKTSAKQHRAIRDLERQNRCLRSKLSKMTREKEILKQPGDGKLLELIEAQTMEIRHLREQLTTQPDTEPTTWKDSFLE